MTLTRREKILIIVGSIIVVVALYLTYFLFPCLNSFNSANRKLSDYQAQLNTLNVKAAGDTQLQTQIDDLNNQLKTEWSSVPVGMDHARILLYLKKLTDGRSDNVVINVPTPMKTDGPFLTQALTIEFNTTYADLRAILSDLKRNQLYSKIMLVKADYVPQDSGAAPASEETAVPQATLTPEVKNVISVHIELSFYALRPAGNEQPQPAMTPTNTERVNSLMP